MTGAFLAKGFEYTAEIIRNQVSEIGPREALIQPFADSHSVNWLLGHIVSSRSFPLKLLRQAPVWGEEARALSGWKRADRRGGSKCTANRQTHEFV